MNSDNDDYTLSPAADSLADIAKKIKNTVDKLTESPAFQQFTQKLAEFSPTNDPLDGLTIALERITERSIPWQVGTATNLLIIEESRELTITLHQAKLPPESMANQLLNAYSHDGELFPFLQTLLQESDLLRDRSAWVDEVLASFSGGHYYTSICGTLPLIEGTINRYLDRTRTKLGGGNSIVWGAALVPVAEFGSDLLGLSALRMFSRGVSDTWGGGSVKSPQDKILDLYRNVALHGNAMGWNTQRNATYALVLLAATAIVISRLEPNQLHR